MLFHLYNRNHAQNHIFFGHVLIWAGIFAAAGFLLFFALKRIVGSGEGALLLTVLYWLCFWMFGSMIDIILRLDLTFPHSFFLAALALGLIFITVLFRRFKPPFDKIRPAFNALSIAILVLFAFNLTPAIRHNFALQRARAMMMSVDEVARPFYVKQNFFIDTALPAPDIYWFHIDGMMSLQTMARLWGEPQEHLREELSRRGFKLYDNALLVAGGTNNALAILFSPAFSDSFFRGRLLEIKTGLGLYEAERIFHELHWATLVSGASVAIGSYEYFELINAFLERGYIFENTCTRLWQPAHRSRYLLRYFPVDFFIDGPLPDLLTVTTPFRFLRPIIERNATVRHQPFDFTPDPSSDPLARFVFKSLFYAHMGQTWRQDPALREMDRTAVHLYPLAFDYAAQRMLSLIDNVLEENPNAVIVLQADHGLHLIETRQHLLALGYTPEQVLELWFSVFSAVRIPDQYGALEAPIAPLNISRELVNRFVGHNYNLLP